MKLSNISILLLLLLISNLSAFPQENQSKLSFELAAGVGVSDGNGFIGGGYNYSIGMKRLFKYDRLSFNPRFDISFMGARLVTDVPDQYFNSLNFDLLLGYDLIRLNAVSLNLQAGPATNFKKGLKGTGGMPPGRVDSEYFNSGSLAFAFGGSIKIEPKKERYYILLSPLNFRIGSNYFMEAFGKLGLGFKL